MGNKDIKEIVIAMIANGSLTANTVEDTINNVIKAIKDITVNIK